MKNYNKLSTSQQNLRAKKLKIFFLFLLICVAVLAFILFVKVEAEKRPTTKTKPLVEIFITKKQKIYDPVEALGTAIANESVDITTNVTEIVKTVDFTDNMSVKKDQIIITLEMDEELAQKREQELQLKEHERELKRLQRLVRKKAATKQQLEQRKTLVEISKQKIAQIEAKIANRIIKAPFDGVLGLRNISKGSLIKPGDLITTLDDLSKINIDFVVPAIYLPNLFVDMPIRVFSDVYADQEFIGKISFIDSRVDQDTRSIKVRAVIDNEDLILRQGLLLDVVLFKNERLAVLIPEESIISNKNQNFIYILDEKGQVKKQEVILGKRQQGLVEVKSGLADNIKIVSNGIIKIRDGDQVQILDNSLSDDEQQDNE